GVVSRFAPYGKVCTGSFEVWDDYNFKWIVGGYCKLSRRRVAYDQEGVDSTRDNHGVQGGIGQHFEMQRKGVCTGR
ncbi:hypothetical protein A2U01_0095486, partial [Trifolium medium]|nr:hypothetical protein [Trifolium medium]